MTEVEYIQAIRDVAAGYVEVIRDPDVVENRAEAARRIGIGRLSN